MTEAKYSGGGNLYTLSAIGHATGDQNVCAAVSTLVQTLMGYLVNLERQEEATILNREYGDGVFRVTASGGDRCRGAFEVAWFGFCQLAHSFPEQVSIKK